MRKKIVAGNWKMNKTLQDGIQLTNEVINLVKAKPDNSVIAIFGTPFIHLPEVSKLVDNKRFYIAAQNCSWEPKGAFTGEVSAEMIKSTGATYVIIGHSERRSYFKEDDAMLLKKVNLVLQNGLKPIFCCGEVLQERESGIHFKVVEKQLGETIFKLTPDNFQKLVIAYEPVWAIGTGKTASPAQAQEMHKFIRESISAKFGKQVADDTTIQYGGSCNAANAKELFSNPDVDGGLIGGASLKAEDFVSILYSY